MYAKIDMEIKSAQTFSPSFCKGLDVFTSVFGDRCGRGEVVYRGWVTAEYSMLPSLREAPMSTVATTAFNVIPLG